MRAVPSNPSIINMFSYQVPGGAWVHNCFSNGFIEPDGTFVEREYHAERAADPRVAAEILRCEKPFGPGGSKELGRAAEHRLDWDDVAFQVMTRLVLKKFLDHEELAKKLLETDYALLIEGNSWHDNKWGDCRCNDPGHPECKQPGLNWLGHVLMGVRESLRLLPQPCL